MPTTCPAKNLTLKYVLVEYLSMDDAAHPDTFSAPFRLLINIQA